MRRVPALMIQGTGSNVGKSTMVAGLCRVFARQGIAVRPFKAQNMSNNAAVTADGGEIGRAQAVQAIAAKVAASVHMNPVLLKPESDTGSQVIVQGKRWGHLKAFDFGTLRQKLLPAVLDSFARLSDEAGLILVEGAGSPAEINLRQGDIANMGFAEAADVPVVLAGDIDRGGVIASLVGTHTVLPGADRNRIKAFLINKFRGDIQLFSEGEGSIARMTGWPSLGVVPWFTEAARLPAEDAVDLEGASGRAASLVVAVPVLRSIANFDDLDPLAQESGVELVFVPPGEVLPARARLVVLPGSKATISDLAFFRAQGWDIDLAAHVRRGGRVLGLCGGYQMLGKTIADPQGIEGLAGRAKGLGLLDVETELLPDKTTRQVRGRHISSGLMAAGYEIHLGVTRGPDCTRPMFEIDGRSDGACSRNGLIEGCYMHGLFSDDAFRATYLREFGLSSALRYRERIEATLEALADHLEKHLDIGAMLRIAQERSL